LKEFKVLGGSSPDQLIEIVHSGLRNDDEPEIIPVKHSIDGHDFPILYVKIVPMQAFSPNYNFSIWFIELLGVNNPEEIQVFQSEFNAYKDREACRLCLKYLRQHQLLDIYEKLREDKQCVSEDPILSQLYQTLVLDANFEESERLIAYSVDSGFMQEHISMLPYQASWKCLGREEVSSSSSSSNTTTSSSFGSVRPGKRGGHQMCLDESLSLIFLFAGWDGTRDLADLWQFDIGANRWQQLAEDTSLSGGPGPRSCHKICYDHSAKIIYTLGKYVDPDNRDPANLQADFYAYHVASGIWKLLSTDTYCQGGPQLIYDHQMCLDADHDAIYVFGGRTISSAVENCYSGLYRYSIRENSWRLLRSDAQRIPYTLPLKSRIGHSMLFSPKQKLLYIFAGQRNKDYLGDFFVYSTERDEVIEMSRDSSWQRGPEPGFTQRATIDIEKGEFYVLSGLMRDKNSNSESVRNCLWVYNIERNAWMQVESRGSPSSSSSSQSDANHGGRRGGGSQAQTQTLPGEDSPREPSPRFAHQLVYHSGSKHHYLFGGNPGDSCNPKERLDDFWCLSLHRAGEAAVLQQLQFRLRRQCFLELCGGPDSMMALSYLQEQVSAVVNHGDPAEVSDFQQLASHLFQASPTQTGRAARYALFESLLRFYPRSMQQPQQDISELIVSA
jgi:muskelin